MSKNIFDQREQAFEAVFFAKLDEEKIAAMRAKRERETALNQLADATGVQDQGVLQKILDMGITPDNLEALTLVPLVMTAWASGEVTASERKAALKAVREQGVSEDSVAYELFEAWLERKPSPELESAWAGYVKDMLGELDADSAEQFRSKVMDRCLKVAEASGGFLGLGSISADEQATIKRLAAAMR